jgi:hypothetical protein
VNLDDVRDRPLNALFCKAGSTALATRIWLNMTPARNNLVLLGQLAENLRCVSWEEHDTARDSNYDLVIKPRERCGRGRIRQKIMLQAAVWAHMNGDALEYTEDSRGWFDLSVISIYGKSKADILKFQKRRTYQETNF